MKRLNLNLILSLLLVFSVIGCAKKERAKNYEINIKKELTENWVQLFNGVDLNDWIVKINGYPLQENIHNTFRVEDSILKVSYDGYEKFGNAYGHLFYKEPFSSYKLKLKYRFVGQQPSDGEDWAYKNSGVMIHSQSPHSMGIDQGFPVSLEVQFLGGRNINVDRPTGNLCTPGTHVKIDDKLISEHCISSTSKTYYDDQWIDVEVLVLKDSLISHRINGNEVISYTNPIFGGEFTPENDEWKSKDGKPVTSGYLALQSESHPIEFKEIKLLKLE